MLKRNLPHLRALLVVAGLALTLGGCTHQIRVQSDFDPQANFSPLNSYSWLPDLKPTNDPRLDDKILDRRIREAVDRHLAAKGYRKVDGDSPSFLVAYYVSMQRQSQTINQPMGGYYGYRWWGGVPSTSAYVYDEGTLILDVIDPRTKVLMWRGFASGTIDWKASVKEREERIDTAVGSLLEKFPPQPQ